MACREPDTWENLKMIYVLLMGTPNGNGIAMTWYRPDKENLDTGFGSDQYCHHAAAWRVS